jgi:mannose-6-phosphate isomerase-like protein (cupin superfamily)
MFLGFFAWYAGLARGGTARVSQLQLLQLPLTVLWGILFLHESVGVGTIALACVVVASAAAAVRFRAGKERTTMLDRLPENFRNNEDVKYGMLRVVDIPSEATANVPWFNQTLTTVNEAVVRLGLFQGDFPWHKHVDQDEFFLVLEGEMSLDVEGREPVVLRQHEGYTVPKGTMHRPRSPQRSVVLMVESLGIVPTGTVTETPG